MIADLKNPPAGIRYSFSVLVVGAAFGILLILSPVNTTAPISLFLSAVAISSWFGGAGPGFVSILLSTLLFDCFFAAHPWSAHGTKYPCISFYFPTGLLICAITVGQRALIRKSAIARQELQAVVQELRQANARLDHENMQRKQVQEKLHISDTILRQSQKVGHTGSWRLHLKDWTMEWTDGHYRVFGCDPSEDKSCIEIYHSRVHPEDRNLVSRIVANAIADQQHFECEYRIVLDNGAVRHIRGSGSPVTGSSSHVTEYIGISVDISEQRQAEALLQKSEYNYRTLAENLPDGVVRYDRNFKRIYINPAQLRHYGSGLDEVLNKSVETDWRADMPVEEYKAAIRNVFETGKPIELYGKWTRIDGSVIQWAVSMVMEENVDGESKTVLAIVRDISTLKEAEHRLQETQVILRRLADRYETVREEERKRLARELHDDLAQRLSALRMRMAVLKMQCTEKNRTLAQETKVMIDMVDETIKFARNAIVSLRPTVLDIGIVMALEWLADDFSKTENLKCNLQASKEIRLSERATTAIFRIAQESLRNVVRHAMASCVDISLHQKDEQYVLVVQDDGVGFDPQNVKKDSFGLIGIQERAHILGGKMNVETVAGFGTRISVHIPALS